MSSGRQSSALDPACRKCGASATGTPWLYVLGSMLLTLGFLPHNPGRLCADCTDRYNAIGVLLIGLFGLGIALALVVALPG